MAEHNLPLLIMEHLPQLIKSACPNSKIASRTESTHLVTDCRAVESKQEIVRKFGSQPYSIINDEITDVGTEKSLALVIRFYDEDQSKVRDAFFGLIKLRESIYNSVCTYLKRHNLLASKLLRFGTDNTSVMMGNINGVQARFREVVPQIFVLGCSSHSLHLCATIAAQKCHHL
ncbi:protein of unknown function (DUF4371) [Popillia japonica]|uniref:DUF4371 domain-containing protein n=1 Tax=Popillia japonica TaxID=7064 RepID=A0AAW1M283_POPJA